MKYVGVAFLALIGLFAGGCSIAFSTMVGGGDDTLSLLRLCGFGIAALCAWGIFRLLR